MNIEALAAAVCERGERFSNALAAAGYDSRDARDLARALSRILLGQSIHAAFGAPGDWGYGTAIGKALAAAYASGSGAGPVRGTLEVGCTPAGDVVVNHPDLDPDANGVGHIVFSPAQARNLADLLRKHAAACVGEEVENGK